MNPKEFETEVNDVVTLYSILDKKSGVYSPPFEARTDEEAKRICTMCAFAETGSLISKYPGDFSLYKISLYNKRSGAILSIPPLFLSDVSDLLLTCSSLFKSSKIEEKEKDKELSETVPSPATV